MSAGAQSGVLGLKEQRNSGLLPAHSRRRHRSGSSAARRRSSQILELEGQAAESREGLVQAPADHSTDDTMNMILRRTTADCPAVRTHTIRTFPRLQLPVWRPRRSLPPISRRVQLCANQDPHDGDRLSQLPPCKFRRSARIPHGLLRSQPVCSVPCEACVGRARERACSALGTQLPCRSLDRCRHELPADGGSSPPLDVLPRL